MDPFCADHLLHFCNCLLVGIIEPVVSVLIHPTPAARLSAAWCLRSIAVALPSQMTILIERCMSRMHHLKSSPEAISGYSFALAALLGGVRYTSLGIPHAKGKVANSFFLSRVPF